MILISHNPKLIVTSDADQVLVALAERPQDAQHPGIIYSAGALADVGTEGAIRARAVKQLEGGRDPSRPTENGLP